MDLHISDSMSEMANEGEMERTMYNCTKITVIMTKDYQRDEDVKGRLGQVDPDIFC